MLKIERKQGEYSNNQMLMTKVVQTKDGSPHAFVTPDQVQSYLQLAGHPQVSSLSQNRQVSTSLQNPIISLMSDPRTNVDLKMNSQNSTDFVDQINSKIIKNYQQIAGPFAETSSAYFDDKKEVENQQQRLNEILQLEITKQRDQRFSDFSMNSVDEFDEFAQQLEDERKQDQQVVVKSKEQHHTNHGNPVFQSFSIQYEQPIPVQQIELFKSESVNDQLYQFNDEDQSLQIKVDDLSSKNDGNSGITSIQNNERIQNDIESYNHLIHYRNSQKVTSSFESQENRYLDDRQAEPEIVESQQESRPEYDKLEIQFLNKPIEVEQHSQQTNSQYMSIQEPNTPAEQEEPSINPNVGMFQENYQNTFDSNGDNQLEQIHLENFNKHFQKDSENSMQVLIKHYLVKHQSDRRMQGENKTGLLVSQRILNSINFNKKNKLLSVVDAGMTDIQLQFFIQTIDLVILNLGELNDPELKIKGLNLNGNVDLTDVSVREIADFLKKHKQIIVLSIERFQASHQSINYLFQHLPQTNIVELNLSGIPVNYFCIDSLCKVINDNKKLSLRVIHLRNTKLNDLAALKLLTQLIDGYSKIKYLSMSMNNSLGFKFQQSVIQMLQQASRRNHTYSLKYLDLNFCNMSQANLDLVKKLIKYNNGELKEHEKREIRKKIYSVKSKRSDNSIQKLSQSHENLDQSRFMNNLKQQYVPYHAKKMTSVSPHFSANGRSQANLRTEKQLQLSLSKLSQKKNVHKSQNFDLRLQDSQHQLFDSVVRSQNNRQMTDNSIHEITIKQDTTDFSQNIYKTNQTLQKRQKKVGKLNESQLDMGKQLKFSKSDSRGVKSKSLSEIIKGGIQEIKPSTDLISNLNKLDMINNYNKGKNDVNSSQVILDSIKKVDVKTMPTAYKLQGENLNYMQPRIFQMSSQGSVGNNSRNSSKKNGSITSILNTKEDQKEYGQNIQQRVIRLDQTFQKLNHQHNTIQIKDDPQEHFDQSVQIFNQNQQVDHQQFQGPDHIEHYNSQQLYDDQYLNNPPNINVNDSQQMYQSMNDLYSNSMHNSVENMNHMGSIQHPMRQQFAPNFNQSMNEDLYHDQQRIHIEPMSRDSMNESCEFIGNCVEKRHGYSQQHKGRKQLKTKKRSQPKLKYRMGSMSHYHSQDRMHSDKSYNRRSSNERLRQYQQPKHDQSYHSKLPGFTFTKSKRKIQSGIHSNFLTRSFEKDKVFKQRNLSSNQKSRRHNLNGKRYSMPNLQENHQIGGAFDTSYLNTQNESINLIINEPSKEVGVPMNHNRSQNQSQQVMEKHRHSCQVNQMQQQLIQQKRSFNSNVVSSFASRKSSMSRSQNGKYIKKHQATRAEMKQRKQIQKKILPKQFHVQRIDMQNRFLRNHLLNQQISQFQSIETSNPHYEQRKQHEYMCSKTSNTNHCREEKTKELTTTSSFNCIDYRHPKFMEQQNQFSTLQENHGQHQPSQAQGFNFVINNPRTYNNSIQEADQIGIKCPVQSDQRLSSIQTTMPQSELHSTRYQQSNPNQWQNQIASQSNMPNESQTDPRNSAKMSAVDLKSQQLLQMKRNREGSNCLPVSYLNKNHRKNQFSQLTQKQQQLDQHPLQQESELQNQICSQQQFQKLQENRFCKNFNYNPDHDGVIVGEADCLQNGGSSKNYTERNEILPLTNRNFKEPFESISNQNEGIKSQNFMQQKLDQNPNDYLDQTQIVVSDDSHSLLTNPSQKQTLNPVRMHIVGGQKAQQNLQGHIEEDNRAYFKNVNIDHRRLNILDHYERDNTKSCSSKSPRISPISNHKVFDGHTINFQDQQNPQNVALNRLAIQQNQENAGEIHDYGNLKTMIRNEISRLQSLYKNIDTLIGVGQHEATIRQDMMGINLSNHQPSDQRSMRVSNSRSAAGFATDHTGRSHVSSEQNTNSTLPVTRPHDVPPYYQNIYHTKLNSNRNSFTHIQKQQL